MFRFSNIIKMETIAAAVPKASELIRNHASICGRNETATATRLVKEPRNPWVWLLIGVSIFIDYI